MPIVKFYASLRNTAGDKEIHVPAATLRLVLDSLVERFPALQQQVWDGTVLRPHVVVTLNGQVIDPETGLEIPVGPDDHIAIFPPIAGGAYLKCNHEFHECNFHC